MVWAGGYGLLGGFAVVASRVDGGVGQRGGGESFIVVGDYPGLQVCDQRFEVGNPALQPGCQDLVRGVPDAWLAE